MSCRQSAAPCCSRQRKMASLYHEHWPESKTERRSPLEQSCDRLVWITQSLHVREVATRLDGKHERHPHLPAPRREHRSFRQPIEGVVDLDSVEVSRVVRKPLRRLQVRWIERGPPRFVVPS